MDNRVFQLAEKIKQDNIQIKKDLVNGDISEEFYRGCMSDSEIMLEYMEEIWDVNLSDYFIEW